MMSAVDWLHNSEVPASIEAPRCLTAHAHGAPPCQTAHTQAAPPCLSRMPTDPVVLIPTALLLVRIAYTRARENINNLNIKRYFL